LSRRSARDTAFKLIFEYSSVGEFNPDTRDIMRDCFDKGMNENAWVFVSEIIDKYTANSKEIDETIAKHSTGWKLNHMAKVELSILRLGVTELLFCDDIAESITINECVEMTKRYSTNKSSKFVNGVLGAVAAAPSDSKVCLIVLSNRLYISFLSLFSGLLIFVFI